MTVEVPVSVETAEIIQRLIDKGRYPDAATALAEGVRLLDEHDTRKALQANLDAANNQIDRGE